MKLEKINLTHFRNYSSCSLANFENVNLILGKNGSGKTNLIDGIHYSCFGRSYFSSTDRKVMQWDESFFRIEASIRREDDLFQIVAKVKPGSLKEIEVNGKKLRKVSEIIGEFPVIAISPKEIYALLLTSEARRKIIDQLISQFNKSYLQDLQQYNSILVRRNQVLKNTEQLNHLDKTLIQTYDEQLCNHAKRIHQVRLDLMSEIRPLFESYYKKICSDRERCSLVYKSQLLENDMQTLLEEKLEKDFYMNRTSIGVHKDDFVFMINDHPLNAFGSQGQLKSFVIALKLSLFEILKKHNRFSPILLLDDIFDKFDEMRTSSLMELIFSENFGQVFITDANVNRMPDLLDNVSIPYRKIVVEKGQIL